MNHLYSLVMFIHKSTDLRDLKPHEPHDSRQLKFMNWGLLWQKPNLDH